MLKYSQTADFYSVIGGTRIAFRAYNLDVVTEREAPLIIFLHEGLGSIQNWRDFPKTIADELNLPVLLYDRRGYGATGGPFPDYMPSKDFNEKFGGQTYLHGEALFLRSIIEYLSPSSIYLVGHSDGASISLIYAAAYPEIVKGIVAIAPHIFLEDAALKGIEKTRIAFNTGRLKSRLEAQHGVDRAVEVFNFWADNWTGVNFLKFDFRPALSAIISPVLALQGDRDEYATLEQIDFICSKTKNCKKVILPDCGHIPHITSSKDLSNIIVDFINQSAKTRL